jgi:hypothetical protein
MSNVAGSCVTCQGNVTREFRVRYPPVLLIHFDHSIDLLNKGINYMVPMEFLWNNEPYTFVAATLQESHHWSSRIRYDGKLFACQSDIKNMGLPGWTGFMPQIEMPPNGMVESGTVESFVRLFFVSCSLKNRSDICVYSPWVEVPVTQTISLTTAGRMGQHPKRQITESGPRKKIKS